MSNNLPAIQLPVYEVANPYLQALQLPDAVLIKNMQPKERKTLLMGAINSAIFIGGWKSIGDNDMILTCNTLEIEIARNFSFLTNLEVKNAFENGAKGYYGESYGMSINGAIKWLKAYSLDDERMKAKTQALPAAAETKMISGPPKITDKTRAIFCQNAYQSYLRAKKYDDYGNLVYMFLIDTMVLPGNDFERFLDAAMRRIHIEAGQAKTREEKRVREQKIDQILNGDMRTPGILARKLAVESYFHSLSIKNIKTLPLDEYN